MSDVQTESPRQSQFQFGKVLLLVVPVGVLLIAGAIAWGWFDLPSRFHEWTQPPLVEATGRIYLNSEPLEGAEVTTRPIDNPRGIAKAYTDAEGRFRLKTDVRGDWKPGAYAGEHLVTISRPDPSVPTGPFKPPTITPPKSEEFDTTELRLMVDRDPSRNVMEFRLEYTLPPKPAGKGKMPPFGGGKMGAKGPSDMSKKMGKGGFLGGKTGFGPGKPGSPPESTTPASEKTEPSAEKSPVDAKTSPEAKPTGDAPPSPPAKQPPTGDAKPATT